MRVLVTGATGFIGRHVIDLLVASDAEVHVLGRTPPHMERLPFHRVDLMDANSTRAAVEDAGASHLLHLAWDATPAHYRSTPANLDWVSASLTLLRAFVERGGSRALMAGTCAEYAWTSALLDELAPCSPTTLYGSSKDALRRVAMAYAAETSVSLAWARIFFLFGPGEPRGRLVADAIGTLLDGGVFPTTTGEQKRDYLYVRDAAAALVAVLASAVHGPVNIGSGEALPVKALLETIRRRIGPEGRIDFGARARSPSEPPEFRAVTRVLREEVGFVPATSLEEGVAETVAWWADRKGWV